MKFLIAAATLALSMVVRAEELVSSEAEAAQEAANAQIAQEIVDSGFWGNEVCCNPREECFNPCACPPGEVLVARLHTCSTEVKHRTVFEVKDADWKCIKVRPDCNVQCGLSKYKGFCGFCQSICERDLKECRFPKQLLSAAVTYFGTWSDEADYLSFDKDGFAKISTAPAKETCSNSCGCDAFPICLTRQSLLQRLQFELN